LRLWVVRVVGHEHTDTAHALALLRARDERQGDSASNSSNEVASPHIGSQAQDTAFYAL
jgi:hypothetical protein